MIILFILASLCFAAANAQCPVTDDLSTQLPSLVSVDLQDEYTETLFVVAVADFFESSLYSDGAGNLVQRVYWRDSSPAEYTAGNQQFRFFEYHPLNLSDTEGAALNASIVVDVAAEAMAIQGRVLYVIATSNRFLQAYILELPPAPQTNVTVVALNATLVNQTSCANPNSSQPLLVDVTCDWQLLPPLSTVTCFIYALECGTLHTYTITDAHFKIQETTCTHSEYNYAYALSLQVEVPSFPSTSPSGVLLSHALVATNVNGSNPQWLFATHLCQPSYGLGNATLSSTLATFDRSGVAADDAGALVLRTRNTSVIPLGAFRTWLLIASPYYGNRAEFFDPIDRDGTLVLSTPLAPAAIIRRLAASHTDYSQHALDALFVVEFYAPNNFLVAGAFRFDGGSLFIESLPTAYLYDSRVLSMGTVFEFDLCSRPLPIVAASLSGQGGSDVLLFNFTEHPPTSSPTSSPTPSPTIFLSQEPIRDRTDIPMPNSVIEGSVFRGTCANNTWVRPAEDPHRDECSPYATVASNNASRPLWFSFETQLEPAAYMIYTDPSTGTCANPETTPHQASPIAGTVVSLWCHCYYNAQIDANGIDSCSTKPVAGMAEDQGFLGPACLNPDTMYLIRVRGDTPEQAGEFDINVEEWSLRRGGDHCSSARPLDHINIGENDQSSCKSAVYTNLCAPPAGRDLNIKCPAVNGASTTTTWFSYETRSFGTGPASLTFDVRFDDIRSMTTIGTLPFNNGFNGTNLNVSFTLSVWRACETLLETPLLCETLTGTLDNNTLSLDFSSLVITESVNAAFTTKKLRPHTTYYIAISTAYRGDFGICALEDQMAPDVPLPPGYPTPAPTPLPCNVNPNAGNCSNVCALPVSVCNDSLSIDSHLFVQDFSGFSAGDFGPNLAAQLTGIDIIARGKACQCCMQPMLFDTANATGDDCELATPNRRYENGTGCGAGGAEGEGVNFRNLGLCLIVSEDGDSIDPDSLREAGVVLEISFCATVQLEYVVFINARRGTRVTLFDAAGEDYPNIPMRDLGANSVYNMTFNNPKYAPPFISKMEIEFGPGGACIAEFAYRILGLNALCGCNTTAPLPSLVVAPGAGACCFDGGSGCEDYPAQTVCDVVKRGKWFDGRSCLEGNFCPNQHGGSGELFGWQHDDRNVPLGDNQNIAGYKSKNWGFGKEVRTHAPPTPTPKPKPRVVRVKSKHRHHGDSSSSSDDS